MQQARTFLQWVPVDKFRVSRHFSRLCISLRSIDLHISIFFMFFFLSFLSFFFHYYFFFFSFYFFFFFETDTNSFSIHTAVSQKALFPSLDYSIAKTTKYLISDDNIIVWIPIGLMHVYVVLQNFTTEPRICKITFQRRNSFGSHCYGKLVM